MTNVFREQFNEALCSRERDAYLPYEACHYESKWDTKKYIYE